MKNNHEKHEHHEQEKPLSVISLLVILFLILAGCSNSNTKQVIPTQPKLPPPQVMVTTNPTKTATTPVTATPITPPTLTIRPTSTSSPAASPTPRLNLVNTKTEILAEGLPAPDDLFLAPDGSIYVSDIVQGTVSLVSPGGMVSPVISGLSEPEGIVLLADGRLLIAEQGKNRIMVYSPATKTLSQFMALKNTTGQAGVDGIALDRSGQLIIPDSPNGDILRASLDGQVTVIGRGFSRPTSAWAEEDGSILVTEENGNVLSRLAADGKKTRIDSLPTPDDVVEDQVGNIFVTTLGDNAVYVIVAGSQAVRRLIGGFSQPQGLILDSQGNLVVADFGHHRLVRVLIHQ